VSVKIFFASNSSGANNSCMPWLRLPSTSTETAWCLISWSSSIAQGALVSENRIIPTGTLPWLTGKGDSMRAVGNGNRQKGLQRCWLPSLLIDFLVSIILSQPSQTQSAQAQNTSLYLLYVWTHCSSVTPEMHLLHSTGLDRVLQQCSLPVN